MSLWGFRSLKKHEDTFTIGLLDLSKFFSSSSLLEGAIYSKNRGVTAPLEFSKTESLETRNSLAVRLNASSGEAERFARAISSHCGLIVIT